MRALLWQERQIRIKGKRNKRLRTKRFAVMKSSIQGWYKTQATMADVAAFMHEVELEMGMMPQG